MSLKLASHSDLWRLVDELRRPFLERDKVWKARRDVRFRRMHDKLKALPLNPRVADTALMVHQSEVPNQEVHVRTKRLVANKPRFEVVIHDDEPKSQALGQELEDGVKALYKWTNRGKVPFDWKLTELQQGDGLGLAKAVWVPGHGDTLGAYDLDAIDEEDEDDTKPGAGARNKARASYRKELAKIPEGAEAREDQAYDTVTETALRAELPPVRFVAVDPVGRCYWFTDDDGIELIAEVSEKRLNPLLSAFADQRLRFDSSRSRLFVDEDGSDVVGDGGEPQNSRIDLSLRCLYTEIRSRTEIVILIEHPKITEKAPKASRKQSRDEDKGVILRFTNPFGPYTTGYALVPADVTTEDREEDKYQPPILASLVAAQELNVLGTAQLSAALEGALAPPYAMVKPESAPSPTDDTKAPKKREGEIPLIPGEIKRIEAPSGDLERIADRIISEESAYRFREVLSGDATSDTSGHRLALQVAQADIQMVPYQTARADAIKELLMGVLYAIRRHGLTVYIPTLPDGQRQGQRGALRVQDRARLTPEMADLNFDLIVTLGAETPTTKYAKLAALREEEEAGIIGYQTVVEQSGAENPEDEIARVFEGKGLKRVMEGILPRLSDLITAAVERRFAALTEPPPEEMPAEMPAEDLMAVNPATGLAGGGGAQPMRATDLTGRVPGAGMPPTQYTSEYGPSVPEGAEQPVVV